MQISGVYKIQSKTKPERIYIGSGVKIYSRWSEHLSDLRKNKHHSKKLQYHFNKYGIEDLQFSIIVICSKEELRPIDKVIWIEQFFIWVYKFKGDNKPYFNGSPTAGSPFGFRHSEETKRKLSEHLYGNKYVLGKHWKDSKESIQRRIEARKNYRPSEITKQKISNSHKGKKLSEEHKRKIGLKSKGRKLSIEICERRSKMLMGHVVSKETRKKISNANKGRKWSDETRIKISEIRKNKKRFTEMYKKIGLSNRKPIIQYDLHNIFIKDWSSIIEASKILHIATSGIINCLRGKYKTTGGFIFEYK